MKDTWESLFIRLAKQKEHSEKYINECLNYAKCLHDKNLPVIFDVEHLAMYLDKETGELKRLINTCNFQYKNFKLQKRGKKGTREINAPFKKLKKLQQWININILCRDKNILPCCHAFIPKDMLGKRNILTNASPHQGKLWILKMDLKNFFPNIRYKQVLAYFHDLGYTEEVAMALAKLCCKNYRLPQGAPSSPMIANHVANGLDKLILKYSEVNNFSYTRYADDITISGNSHVDVKDLITDIENIIFSCGFFVNRKKTKFRKRGNKQTVTGLTVSNGIHVPKVYRKEILKELHCCLKFGVSKHIEFRNQERKKKLMLDGLEEKDIKKLGFYRQWLLGRIMYVRLIEPESGNRMLKEYNKINWIL